LLDSQRSLFSPEELTQLGQLIAGLPDEIAELSQAIAFWCNKEEHTAHLNTLRQVRQTLSNNTLESGSQANTDRKTPDSQINKQTLQNAIHQIPFA